MKLIKLHIENFGKLSNFDFTFSDGINTLYRENSFGKTTLGSFIKVMFFGFDKDTSRKGDRERQKYKPWQGGTYGGSIWFEVDGKQYEMSRVFKEKAVDDEFVLRDANTLLISNDYSKDEIGKEIFSVDAGSFERTMFISQNEYEYGDKNDIDAKIGNLVDNTDDINNYESAKKRLEDCINELVKRGSKGKLDQVKTELSELQYRVTQKRSIEQSIDELNKSLADYNNRINDKNTEITCLNGKIDELSEWMNMAKDKVEYTGLLDSYNHFSNIYNTEKTFFNNVIPEENELNKNVIAADKLTSYKTLMSENKLSENEEITLVSLDRRYSGKNIEDIAFDSMESKINKCLNDKKRINEIDLTDAEKVLLDKESKVFSVGFSSENNSKLIKAWDEERPALSQDVNSLKLTITEEERIKNLEGVFKDNTPDKSTFDDLKIKWTFDRKKLLEELSGFKLSSFEQNELERLSVLFNNASINDTEFDNYSELASSIKEDSEKEEELSRRISETEMMNGSIKIFTPLFIVGIILGILGLLIAFIVPNMVINGELVIEQYPNISLFGYVAVGVGLALMLVSYFMEKNNNTKKISDGILALKKELEEVKKRKEEKVSTINNFLSTYGKEYSDDILLTLANLKQEYATFTRLVDQNDANIRNAEETNQEIFAIERNIKENLSKYNVTYEESTVLFYLNKIISDYDDYINLKDKKVELEGKQTNNKNRIHEIEKTVNMYLEKYGIDSVPTSNSANLHDLQRRFNQYTKLLEKKNNNELAVVSKEFDILNKEIYEFFENYLEEKVSTDDYYSRFVQIRDDVKELLNLHDKKEKYDDALLAYNNTTETLGKYIRSFSFTVDNDIKGQLNSIQDHFQVYKNNLTPYEEAKNKKEDFEVKHTNYAEILNFCKEVDEKSIKELNDQRTNISKEVEELKKDRDNLDGQIGELNDSYNDICDKEGQIRTLKERKKEMESRLSSLRKASELLQKAKDNLNAKYTAPLNASLSKYFDILAKGSDLSITMDVNKELIIKANGIETTEKNLSEGYKDIVNICYRFALIDAMYKNEQPIIILDDPFINLDPEKVANGVALLNEIAKDKQILYLTCHDSRI